MAFLFFLAQSSSSWLAVKYLHDKLELRGINYTMYESLSSNKDKRKNVLNDYVVEKIEEYLNNY